MATDPYHTFAADLRTSLDRARQLSRHYQSLQQSRKGGRNGEATSPSSPFPPSSSSSSSTPYSPGRISIDSEARNVYMELQDHLETLENDINDVQESVEMLEKRGPELFGVDGAELGRRKRFVQSCTDEVRSLAKTIQEEARRNRTHQSIDMQVGGGGYRDDDDDEDPNLAFEAEQQQQLMSRQDNTLDLIGNTLNSLKRQAGNLGQEIGEQVELIGTLDTEVDTSQSKLARAMGRMDEMVRRSDDRLGGWCVWILVAILFLFLLIAIMI